MSRVLGICFGQSGLARMSMCAKRWSAIAATLAIVCWSHSANASTILIDDFITPQSVTATAAAPVATSSATAPEAIGGERDIRLQFLSGSTALTLASNPFGGELLIHDSGAAVKGTSLTVWDGPDNNANVINPIGLGGVDLVTGGNNRFELDDVFADLVGEIVMTVYDASDATGNTWSRSTLALPGGMFTPTDIEIPFSSFTTFGINGAADFTNVGAISMLIGNTTTGSLDVQMSSIAVVPEPASCLLGLVGMGISCLSLRRRS
ncbi:MAG: PEP-CTERM sorting domain-containing protein [Planctomycetales bacterium]|nr:PEP-CTERM sorting domain-containing protein [Planctomycetales bacterium]